jgi:hypothetical protein
MPSGRGADLRAPGPGSRQTDAMDAAIAGLIGAGLGAVASTTASMMATFQQTRSERERVRAARADEALRAEREALVRLCELLATGTQAVAWLGWAAKVQPPQVLQQEMQTYDKRMRELIPRLLAAEVAAASLSDDAFDRVDPLVRDLIALDTRVGTAAAAFDKDGREATQRLAEAKDAANELSDRSITQVRALLRANVQG